MSWEAVTAIGTVVTAVIIGITGVIALYQIQHLRTASQLQSFLTIMSEATGPQMALWTDYVEKVLPERMKLEAYRRELRDGEADFETHGELYLGGFWEKIGTLVHYKLLEPDVFIDFVAYICAHQWELLRDVAALRRERNPLVWERFEELAHLCEAYMRRRGVTPAEPRGAELRKESTPAM